MSTIPHSCPSQTLSVCLSLSRSIWLSVCLCVRECVLCVLTYKPLSPIPKKINKNNTKHQVKAKRADSELRYTTFALYLKGMMTTRI